MYVLVEHTKEGLVDVIVQQEVVSCNVLQPIGCLDGCWASYCTYTGMSPGSGGATNGLSSSNAYIWGSITRPSHPWMRLCRQSSCYRAWEMCLRSARVFAKSGSGTNEGGFFRNPVASSYKMRQFIASMNMIVRA
jgi:hypothetical protein